MITVLMGHRGTGKSTFLKRLIETTYDLDEQIEKQTGRSVSEWFTEGELRFRQVENEVFRKLIHSTSNATIALGAGFSGEIPREVRCVWLRRETDRAGRCFLNRPRLNPKVNPFHEYMERFVPREQRYQRLADDVLTLPEGYEGGLENVLSKTGFSVAADLTLLPENFRKWDAFVARRKVRFWEIRDDLLSEDQIQRALGTLSRDQILYSCRKSRGYPRGLRVDWPLEMGPPPDDCFSVSLHQDTLDEAMSAFTKFSGFVQKCAVQIRDFAELERGHRWWMENPERRSFLPHSPDGRWSWYRSLFGVRMPLHFFREGEGSALDQPFLWQHLLQPEFSGVFAAVLGHPVEHSRSPLEQREFFFKRGVPFVSVAVAENEFTEAMPVLRRLGLRFAAVTAPLKKRAFELADSASEPAGRSASANCLYLGEKVLAHNTDVLALRELARGLPRQAWLWGGGGVKSSVLAAWPQAHAVSARAGTPETQPPQLLIWAIGRDRPFTWPQVRPGLVLDLNYAENSPGLEFAVREDLPYQSGLTMFKLQAAFQRDFWQGAEAKP